MVMVTLKISFPIGTFEPRVVLLELSGFLFPTGRQGSKLSEKIPLSVLVVGATCLVDLGFWAPRGS